VVLLLGPLPGILFGTACLIVALVARVPQLAEIGSMFTIINVFNLIPVSPFDGGRLFERLLFNRRYWLDVFFRLLTIAALAGLAYLLRTWIFGVLAVFLLLGLRMHMKRARAGFSLVSRIGNLPNNPADLSDDQVLALLASTDESLAGIPTSPKTLPTLRAQTIRELFDQTSSRFASPLATVLCLFAWAAGFFVSFVNFILWAVSKNMAGVN